MLNKTITASAAFLFYSLLCSGNAYSADGDINPERSILKYSPIGIMKTLGTKVSMVSDEKQRTDWWVFKPTDETKKQGSFLGVIMVTETMPGKGIKTLMNDSAKQLQFAFQYAVQSKIKEKLSLVISDDIESDFNNNGTYYYASMKSKKFEDILCRVVSQPLESDNRNITKLWRGYVCWLPKNGPNPVFGDVFAHFIGSVIR